MTRRGWWLVVAGFLLPGSAQLLAGNKKLGRVGIIASITLISLLLITAVVFLVWRVGVFTLFGSSIALVIIEALLILYALLWLALAIDTFRLVRLTRVRERAKAGIAVLAAVFVVVPVGVVAFGATIVDAQRQLVGELFNFAGPAQDPVDGYYTFMLLGGDAGADRWGLRPDSITVVTVDAETGAATLIGIPRNLQNAPFPEDSPMHAEWPNGFNCGDSCMINGVYTWAEGHPDLYPDAAAKGSSPGLEATRDAVEGVTGLTIQFYVLIDMQGFADLVDALGGVRINVTEPVPIAIEGGPIEEWIEPGDQVLSGYYALWYARSRAGTSDYARMERQRQVQEAVIAQFTPSTLLTKYQGIAAAGRDIVETDIPQAMVGYLADLADKTRVIPFTQLELVPPTVITANPDFDVIHQMVSDAMTESSTNPGGVEEPVETPVP
ncbi:LCP family protein [Humidisolicoccus flavus]|uniref:LCP family protein n=1 Tax=Humidisolicoccus flavus TaxID=3111414 RepID=UPI00324B4999